MLESLTNAFSGDLDDGSDTNLRKESDPTPLFTSAISVHALALPMFVYNLLSTPASGCSNWGGMYDLSKRLDGVRPARIRLLSRPAKMSSSLSEPPNEEAH
jgi:hypothetical protein